MYKFKTLFRQKMPHDCSLPPPWPGCDLEGWVAVQPHVVDVVDGDVLALLRPRDAKRHDADQPQRPQQQQLGQVEVPV